MTHTVQPKETLYSISKKYGLSVDQVLQMNGLSSPNLSIGQVLNVGGSSPSYDSGSSNYGGGSSSSDPYSSDPYLYPPQGGGNNKPSVPDYNPPSPTPQRESNYGGGGYSAPSQSVQVQKSNQGSFNSYTISFPTPNGTVTKTVKDRYNSPNTVNQNGISYAGASSFNANIDFVASLCPEPFYAKVLQYISKQEGCFDAVNSYDKAIFSFGFIQFTGAVASGSVLTKVLQRFKSLDPSTFDALLGAYGMDVSGAGFSVGSKQGDAAYLAVANDITLTTAFIATGYAEAMIQAQVEIALQEYVNKAVAPSLLININGSNVPIGNIISSEGGIAFRVDLSVNRGLSGSLIVLKKAIEQLSSGSNLYSLDETAIVNQVAANDVESWKKQRVLKILSSGFSFYK